MPNNIEKGNAIFKIFQKGSGTSESLGTWPGGFLPLLCVHITALFITGISLLTLTVTHGNNTVIQDLTDVHFPFPYLLPPSDLEYSGPSIMAKRSWTNVEPRNKDPHPPSSVSRRHLIWPISASHTPHPCLSMKWQGEGPCHHKHLSAWFGEVQHGKQFLTRKIIYHGQSVENNLISNPSQGKKNWQLALSNLQHGHWDSFIFPSPSPGLDAFRREEE